MLVAWAVSAVVAWRLGHRTLVRLNIVIAAGLALGLISAAKIFGPLFNYLLLWAWGLAGLIYLSIGWTIGLAIGRRCARATPGPGVGGHPHVVHALSDRLCVRAARGRGA